jgi:Na+/proline symporter
VPTYIEPVLWGLAAVMMGFTLLGLIASVIEEDLSSLWECIKGGAGMCAVIAVLIVLLKTCGMGNY